MNYNYKKTEMRHKSVSQIFLLVIRKEFFAIILMFKDLREKYRNKGNLMKNCQNILDQTEIFSKITVLFKLQNSKWK